MENSLKLFSRIITILALVLGGLVVFSTIPDIQLFDTDLGLYIGYALFVVAIAVSIIFPIFNIIQNPRGAVKSVGGLILLVLIFFISYSIAPAEPMYNANTDELIASAEMVKYAGAAIFSGIFVFLAAIVIFVVFEVITALR